MATPDPHSHPTSDSAADPVRLQREVWRRWVSLAKRLGYSLLLVAIILFFVAFATDFNSVMATLIIVAFVASCVLLAPSIVLSYAVKAADRADRDDTW